MKETNGKHNYQHLTPDTVTGQRFTQYYNHAWKFIKKEEGTWTSINEYPISPREIWDKHQDPHQIIGLRFGSTTRIITIDIDRNSLYHLLNDPSAIKTITEALEAIGLCRHVCIQSSDSEGIHLIFSLPEPLPTFKIACLVKATLEAAGLEIKPGQLEVFPNPKRFAKNGEFSEYNGVRLPLQPNSGSYLLDDDLNIISDSVEDFLDQMDWAAVGQDIETFSSQLDPAYEEYKGNKRWQNNGKSRKAQEWEKALEQTISKGWTAYHQTDDLLPKFVAYCIVFQQCVGAKLREAVKEAVINAPGYSQWCRHQHEIDKRIEEVCYYTERNDYYRPYCNFPNRSTNFNQTYNRHSSNQRTLDVEKRITETVAHLEANGELPQQIGLLREVIIKTAKEKYGIGFSIRTLGQKKYLVLWHPKHRATEATIQTPPQSETTPPPDPPNKPPLAQTAPPSKQAKTDTQSEFVSLSPLYEVFEGLEVSPQKKSKIAPTTKPESKPPTEPLLPDAPVQLGELPDDRKLEIAEGRLEIGKNKPLSFKQEKICPQQSAPNNHQSAPNNHQSALCNLQLVELPDHLAKRIASVHSAWQNFLSLGLPIPYGLKRLEESLMAEIAELNSCPDLPGNETPSNGKVDPVEPKGKETEDTTEPTPSTPEDPQVGDTTNQSPTIDNNQSSSTKTESSTNGQPRKLSRKKLLEKCDDYGIEVNRTIQRLIKSNTSEVVLNALEALREHKRQGQVKNPAGFLVKAIKQKWKPTTATNTPLSTPSRSPSPYPSNPMAGITEEFSQWYDQAIASGLVENVPAHHLPLYQHREPMVRVLTPNDKFPYVLLRWRRARELYPISANIQF